MNVSHLMTTDVRTCGPADDLQRAAQIMWEHDCGVVPVVDAERHVLGMVTDRDVCMAAYTQGTPLRAIPVSRVMSKMVHSVREGDGLDIVEDVMRAYQVRRVPVLDAGGKLVGLVSLNDLARHAEAGTRRAEGPGRHGIVQTLAGICAHQHAPGWCDPRSATALLDSA